MIIVAAICKLVIAVVIVDVWLFRRDQSTPYRPEGAKNLREEFGRYGFAPWVMPAVGAAKVSLAAVLVLAIPLPVLALPAAAGMAALMIGAVVSHIRVNDPWTKALPASTMLVLSLTVVAAHVL